MATIDNLIPVDSNRFSSWFYDQKVFELYVKYPPTKKHPNGSIVVYSNVTPEVFEEGNEAESKGHWLGEEIIANPQRYPFRYVTVPAHAAAEPEAPRVDSPLVPEAIRSMAVLPELPLTTVPEILPPEVQQGSKPFNQVVRERATAIALAVPGTFQVSNAEAYKALGTALVVIQTERRAVEKALDTIARPMIEAKRLYDTWRNDVLSKYADAERRLDYALKNFRRAEDTRVRQDEERQRQANQKRAREASEAAEATRRAEATRHVEQVSEHVQSRIQEAQQTIAETTDDVVLAEAREKIIVAQRDLVEATEFAALPAAMMPSPFLAAPVVVAKPDLKVPGLRNKSPLWRWRILARFFRSPELSTLVPIRRTSLVNPAEIPDEYWILDEKAVSSHVKSMDGVCSIPQVESYDLNA